MSLSTGEREGGGSMILKLVEQIIELGVNAWGITIVFTLPWCLLWLVLKAAAWITK